MVFTKPFVIVFVSYILRFTGIKMKMLNTCDYKEEHGIPNINSGDPAEFKGLHAGQFRSQKEPYNDRDPHH